MTTKRQGFIAGGILAGALLLGTAGLAAAQDPTSSPAPNPMWTGPGSGMTGAGMSGQMGAGMSGQMQAQHDQMVASGACDDAQMGAMHAQHHPTN
ncbi:MAG: hypothetical protein AABZ33_05290 [Chloroflexota bacterium]